jgi:hypothetical protein
MSYLALGIIIALIFLIIGIVLGIFLGARLTRSHYLYMASMQQPRQQSARPRTRHLRRDEQDYY